ncbi:MULTISPECIES: Na+/H+ antiporter [unclassified Arthrobacter]|uniref:Na+/H+ antiporter n=1 Tax=unclassified Arthrobacter TaxID=235627 RepID=UPI001D1591D7|nr:MULTISPECIES: Na+/H+ antiporter [unclassified Arthrobacter]MCC3274591.1 Na+/H+ antiporter [Arthrobacter sp. zg-Y20]MCC9177820.1 Na+/H+ antiporter [Arthrobacter sp. zg-Y750]MDK1314748.1 Na+/H+ antiporter [Arthrobacter sp. zg.Y20]WIB07724.1 Na+/H+ antiporter [Arthrobacter sp. zg-Y20]
MEFLMLLICLLFGTVLAAGVGERIRLPYPVLMLIFSAMIAFLPIIPEVHINPELILPLFLPPLLYAAAQRSSWSVFRLRWRSLVLLAVALVAVTVAVVAGVSWVMIPALGLPAAIALGAIVAPPDPVAVEAVAGKVKMPRRLVTVLQTEGLFNDAIAIVIFQAAVAASTSGGVVGWDIVPRFLIGAAGAVVLGLAMAWVVGSLNRFVPNMVARSAATLVAPFAVYLLAEEAHFSGVVAVVVTALELGRRARPQDSEERLTRTAFWDVVELLTTGVAFGLVGIEMRYIIEDEGSDLLGMIPGIVAVCAAVLLVRFLWMLAIYRLGGAEKNHVPGSLKEVLVLTWCGMRGLATLALALALPGTTLAGEALPGRNFVVACAAAVLVVTLVVPGLTLPWLMRVLKLPNDHKDANRKERELALRAEKAAVETMKRCGAIQELPPERRAVLAKRMSSLHSMLQGDEEHDPQKLLDRKATLEVMDVVQREAMDAARREVLAARREPGMDPEAVDRVLRRLDLRTVTMDHREHH